MIIMDYNKLEETLKKYIHAIKYEEGTVAEYAKKLTNYFEALIEKEFKLVIKFNYKKELNMSKIIWQRIKDLDLIEDKNILIYIREE